MNGLVKSFVLINHVCLGMKKVTITITSQVMLLFMNIMLTLLINAPELVR